MAKQDWKSFSFDNHPKYHCWVGAGLGFQIAIHEKEPDLKPGEPVHLNIFTTENQEWKCFHPTALQLAEDALDRKWYGALLDWLEENTDCPDWALKLCKDAVV